MRKGGPKLALHPRRREQLGGCVCGKTSLEEKGFWCGADSCASAGQECNQNAIEMEQHSQDHLKSCHFALGTLRTITSNIGESQNHHKQHRRESVQAITRAETPDENPGPLDAGDHEVQGRITLL